MFFIDFLAECARLKLFMTAVNKATAGLIKFPPSASFVSMGSETKQVV